MDSRFDLILQGIHDSRLFGFFLISNYKKGFWTEQAEYPCVDFKKEKLGLTKKTKKEKLGIFSKAKAPFTDEDGSIF